ncbi:MAG: 2TM domain-containing protein [Alphaproteobacteria bacterium]
MTIRELRLERGWSQEQLADCTGISVRTVQRLENGGTAGLESAKALAAVFETDVSSFLPPVRDIPAIQEDAPMSNGHATTAPLPHISDEQKAAVRREEKEAQRYVTEVKAFYGHVAMFALINPMLIILNLYTSPDYFWFFWPLGGWLIGLASHAIFTFDLAFFMDPEWEEKTYEKKLERIRRRNSIGRG